LKTKSKYLSFGTILLILVLIIGQVSDGFSGILLLPLSRFVYYGLTIGSEIPVLAQVIFITGFFLLIASVLRFSYTNIFNKSRFRLNHLQLSEGHNIVYFASQSLNSRKKSAKTKTQSDSDSIKKTNAEQGLVMISGGCVVFANKSFFKITGFQPLEIFGMDFASLIKPESLINYTMLSRMSIEEIKNSPGIGIITKNNKNIMAFSAASTDNEFKPESVNIFYLKQEETAVKSESTLDSLFFDSIENTDNLHWIWDDKGIIYINQSCRSSLMFPLGKIINRPGLMLKSVRKEDRNALRTSLSGFFQTGKFNEEICCKLQNREVKYFRVSITSQPQNGNSSTRYHAIAYDITEEKQSLKNAEDAALLAETANNNKTAFLANMSHEIRSPLNGIIGFSELLADKNLTDAERERYLLIIQNNGNALISLLSDLIDISKLESGKLVIAKRKFVPARLMDDLKHQFGSSTNWDSDNVKIIFANTTSFRDQEIDSDANRLRQIFVNLITNAIKFTLKGKIEIGADFAGEEMLFWVKDSGSGIPYENQQHIFERFRQVEAPGSEPVVGFGLGLAISKALVELLGGRLWVESIPDVGSLFVFTIKTNIVNNTMETTQIVNNNSSSPVDFRERTILIAEDIDFSFLYIEAVLRRTGVKILWAQNGREAIEHVKTNQDIDLVLMDMQMPLMNGYQATEVISKLRPDLPIIAQTAFVLSDDVKKCYSVGCTGYLAKPIRKEQLMNTLTEYFVKYDQADTMPAYKMQTG
jgi:signal transduction histidine kinase/ActR/RegA family two-component response regulator